MFALTQPGQEGFCGLMLKPEGAKLRITAWLNCLALSNNCQPCGKMRKQQQPNAIKQEEVPQPGTTPKLSTASIHIAKLCQTLPNFANCKRNPSVSCHSRFSLPDSTSRAKPRCGSLRSASGPKPTTWSQTGSRKGPELQGYCATQKHYETLKAVEQSRLWQNAGTADCQRFLATKTKSTTKIASLNKDALLWPSCWGWWWWQLSLLASSNTRIQALGAIEGQMLEKKQRNIKTHQVCSDSSPDVTCDPGNGFVSTVSAKR